MKENQELSPERQKNQNFVFQLNVFFGLLLRVRAPGLGLTFAAEN